MVSRGVTTLIAAALVLSTALTSTAAGADSPRPTAGGVGGASGVAGRVLDGTACKGANFTGHSTGYVTAQDFEHSLDAYDAVAGQAFQLIRDCKVRSIYVEGRGNSHPGMLRLWVYAATSAGLPDPDRVICHAAISDVRGPRFDLPFTCNLEKNTSYVLAVQKKVKLMRGGQWYWNVRAGSAVSSWTNSGDGYGTGCTDWGTLEACLGHTDAEFIFALRGRSAD